MQTVLIHPLSCRLEMPGFIAKPFLPNSPQTTTRNLVAVCECFTGVINGIAACMPVRKTFCRVSVQIHDCILTLVLSNRSWCRWGGGGV